MNALSSVCVLCLILCTDARTSESLKVKLPDGSKLVGRYLTSDSGRGIRAFMGVPYAEPPLGELRFKVKIEKEIAYQPLGIFKCLKVSLSVSIKSPSHNI